jgi:hypothetical protein
VKPFPGSTSRPTSRQPATASTEPASTRTVTTAAFAASTADRHGIAVKVVRIIPVLYSLPIASTARTATAA